MDDFSYRRGRFSCEQVFVEDITAKIGTPTYIYSLATVLGHYRRLRDAFAQTDCLVCYSMKANSNLALLAALAREGCGFDIVSGGELYRLQQAGADISRVLYAGVGKTTQEIRQAIKAGIFMFNIESWPEAEEINRVAKSLKKTVKVDFRLNPNIEAHTHAYISTGLEENKFGLPIASAGDLFQRAKKLKHLRVTGIHLHLGSQIVLAEPYVEAVKKALALIRQLRADGFPIETLNLGGGLGIIYNQETPNTAAQFSSAVMPLLQGAGVRLILEPGRFIVGNAGVLATKVLYVKETQKKTFVIVDAAMNDLLRPSLYQAFHAILPVRRKEGVKDVKADVVGPICESGDFLAKDRKIQRPVAGDGLVVRSAGAYGFAMASNYNSRPRAAEVLVDGDTWQVVRERESYEDLVRGEVIPENLRG